MIFAKVLDCFNYLMKEKSVSQAIEFRRSVRLYDLNKSINIDNIKKCISQATLSPSSSNMQLWEFHHIISNDNKEKIIKACFSQPAAKTADQLVVIAVRKDLWRKRLQSNIDNIKKSFSNEEIQDPKKEKKALFYYEKMVPMVYFDSLGFINFFKKLSSKIYGLFKPTYREVSKSDVRVIAHKSAALAGQSFMISMAGMGYDTCPMEGFDSSRIKKILNLPMNSEISMIISCGIRTKKGVYGNRFRISFDEVYRVH